VGIYGGWGTGKTTLMEMIRNELKQKYSDDVETVWFDSWRYEREEFSAMVPLLRTIILSIEDKLEKIRNSGGEDKKRQALTNLKDTITKVGSTIIRNTTPSIGLKAGAAIEAGATLDIGKIIDDYKSDGSFIRGQERIYFHKHISEHLEEQLQKIRYGEGDSRKRDVVYDFRIVIFVDDLDRCTPERALELLESIKTFFDIEGIIYVIGIDPRTIDPIIKIKYGENAKIDGMDYLQKIVQLPFQIPVWGAEDLSNSIRSMLSEAGIPQSDIDKILDKEKTSVEMIMRASQLNPRDVKRFVNAVVLSIVIFKQHTKDIEKLIAVQAFYFRGGAWLDFLKLITPYKVRTEFLKYFLILIEREGKNVSTIEDLRKLIYDMHEGKQSLILDLDKMVVDIFKKLIDSNDYDLFTFLRKAAMILLKIDNIEKYVRAGEIMEISTKGDISSEISEFDSHKQLHLLKSQNPRQFNMQRSKMGDDFDPLSKRRFSFS
jgi:KAP family P-loop domain